MNKQKLEAASCLAEILRRSGGCQCVLILLKINKPCFGGKNNKHFDNQQIVMFTDGANIGRIISTLELAQSYLLIKTGITLNWIQSTFLFVKTIFYFRKVYFDLQLSRKNMDKIDFNLY